MCIRSRTAVHTKVTTTRAGTHFFRRKMPTKTMNQSTNMENITTVRLAMVSELVGTFVLNTW